METITIKLGELCCNDCGISFWVPTSYIERAPIGKRFFYCPNGHFNSLADFGVVEEIKDDPIDDFDPFEEDMRTI